MEETSLKSKKRMIRSQDKIWEEEEALEAKAGVSVLHSPGTNSTQKVRKKL